MANEALINKGSEIILEAAGASGQLTNDTMNECDSATRASTDNPGYPLGIFEFDTAAGGFGAAPTAGAALHIYEQKINSDGNDAVDPVLDNYEHDYLYTFNVYASDTQQRFVSPPLPINIDGGKYWVKWKDGGAGSTTVTAGWELRLTPCTYGTA